MADFENLFLILYSLNMQGTERGGDDLDLRGLRRDDGGTLQYNAVLSTGKELLKQGEQNIFYFHPQQAMEATASFYAGLYEGPTALFRASMQAFSDATFNCPVETFARAMSSTGEDVYR